MLNYYRIDVLHTRRYVYQDTDNCLDALQATINAVMKINFSSDLKWVYTDDELCGFIENSLVEISSKDVINTDVLLNRDGHYPLAQNGKAAEPLGARYYAILAKYKCRYVVQLADSDGNALEATISAVKKSDMDGTASTCFPFWHNHIREFVADSFAKISKDDVGPNDIMIDYTD